MSVHIQLDQPESRCYTNLDFISGTVVLILPHDATVSAITVKLEGESRTRLAGPKYPGYERSDKKRTELEYHKLLYKVLTVFPTPELQERASGSGYTLRAGQYLYPFRFKFPFNNDCLNNPNPLKDIKVGQLNVQLPSDTCNHVKRTLPPSLSGFPGEAEIRYYVKATVVRPKFFQENIRWISDIKFLPIEPPRRPDGHQETFARRKRQFNRSAQPPKKGLFKKSSTPVSAEDEPPAFQVDVRLPSPAIITCNEPLPLRILVEKINDSSATAFLSMLQIELFGYTRIRAHDLERTESTSWVLKSQANMNMPLGTATEKQCREWKLPSRLWQDCPVPNTVCPTFETCNISRRYELEVRVGLAHAMADGMRPEVMVLPLRLPVQVYSGIAPPPQLLRAMANNPRPQGAPPAPPLFPRPSANGTSVAAPLQPDTLLATPPTSFQDNGFFPAQTGPHSVQQEPDIPDEAPPSYEDAIADEIAPVDGPRRDYQVPSRPESEQTALDPDSKRSGLGRRVSERLFSTSGPAPSQNRSVSTPSTLQTTPMPEDDDAGPASSPTIEPETRRLQKRRTSSTRND